MGEPVKTCPLDFFGLFAIGMFLAGVGIPPLREGWGRAGRSVVRLIHIRNRSL